MYSVRVFVYVSLIYINYNSPLQFRMKGNGLEDENGIGYFEVTVGSLIRIATKNVCDCSENSQL